MGATDLERPCNQGLCRRRGGHGMEHRTDTFEQARAINLPIVDQRMCVAIGRHELRSLTDKLADLCPPSSLLVKQRDSSMAERVRREVRNSRIATSAARSSPATLQNPS